MECKCENKQLHVYVCPLAPKCKHCGRRTDIQETVEPVLDRASGVYFFKDTNPKYHHICHNYKCPNKTCKC